ncbi:hypothetical protein [Raoultibacter timonensis]|uniref:hypothetical protein n=1 Tax=Raoultibacter timonensis TaxID=1907662 RepID=UPI0026DB291E|nr:hypothetical protein [Raoultibacter timonensis]
MAVTGGYYNSRGGDRRYNAEDMSKYFTGLVTRGVLETVGDKLAVNAAGGMAVTVGTGKCYFSDGKWAENSAPMTLELDPAPVIQSRIDRIVVRNDRAEDVRAASIYVLSGQPSDDPQPPQLTNDDYVEEMSLAQILVRVRAEEVKQADVEDERPTGFCGFVYVLGQKVDLDDLYRQHQAIFEQGETKRQDSYEAAEEARDERSEAAVEKLLADGESGRFDASVSVGKVDTLPPDERATVANSGTPKAAVFDFGIPKGRDGAVVDLAPGMFAMTVSEGGHLILTHNASDPAPPMEIRADGHLVYKIGE